MQSSTWPWSFFAVSIEHFDIIGGGGEDALFHGFTYEEIEKNRIITIERDGNERVSTDEEVVQT